MRQHLYLLDYTLEDVLEKVDMQIIGYGYHLELIEASEI